MDTTTQTHASHRFEVTVSRLRWEHLTLRMQGPNPDKVIRRALKREINGELEGDFDCGEVKSGTTCITASAIGEGKVTATQDPVSANDLKLASYDDLLTTLQQITRVSRGHNRSVAEDRMRGLALATIETASAAGAKPFSGETVSLAEQVRRVADYLTSLPVHGLNLANTCDSAAFEIERLSTRVAELEAELAAARVGAAR